MRRLRHYARELRKEQTDAERILWMRLRIRQVGNAKFRRQEPIGTYIVDFVCFEAKLIIELDGGHHNEPEHKVRDKDRTEWLAAQGYRVIRFWNNDVLSNIESVLEQIEIELESTG